MKERKTHNPLPTPAEAAAGTGQAIQPVQRERMSRRSRSPRGQMRKLRRTERPQGGPQSRSNALGGMPPPPEENAYLLGFTPERAHLLLQGVYGDLPHHNDGSHLDRGIADDAVWQRRWRRLAAQSASWYAMPSGAVGRPFTAILAAEWQGVLDRS